MPRLTFIRPLSPSAAVRPPKGDDWLHEPKWDGFRFQIITDGSQVRFYSRHSAEYTERLPGMCKAFAELPADAAIIDGELCLVDLRGAAHFWQLMSQMRSRWPDESRLMFLAFDRLHQDSADLRSETLTQRKRALDRLCRGARVPYLHQVEVFADGEVLFDYCNRFGFEGVVSKRRASGYASGSSRWWVKVKLLKLEARKRRALAGVRETWGDVTPREINHDRGRV
jgi:bifunctional non-homologous end joining protein LigD